MSRYAPGTMGFDLANNAGGNRRQRREDLASGLIGMGGLFNVLGNVNQRNQAYADQQAAIPYMAQAYEHPTGEIPLPEGVAGPPQQGPTAMQGAFQQASSQHVNTFLENVGSAFGFGGRQGRITPQALGQIGAIQNGQIQQGMAMRRDARRDAMDAMAMKLDASRIDKNTADTAYEAQRRPLELAKAQQDLGLAKTEAEQKGRLVDSQIAENNSLIDYRKNGGGRGGVVRPDVLAGKIAESEQKYSSYVDLYKRRLSVETGQDPDGSVARGLSLGGPQAQDSSSSYWQKLSAEMDKMRKLKAIQNGTLPPEALDQIDTPQDPSVQPITAQSMNAPQESAAPWKPSPDEATFLRKYVKAQGWDPGNITPAQEAEMKGALQRQGGGGR